jgi:hypothetical protein
MLDSHVHLHQYPFLLIYNLNNHLIQHKIVCPININRLESYTILQYVYNPGAMEKKKLIARHCCKIDELDLLKYIHDKYSIKQ